MCDLNDKNYKTKLIKVLEKCRKYIKQKVSDNLWKNVIIYLFYVLFF